MIPPMQGGSYISQNYDTLDGIRSEGGKPLRARHGKRAKRALACAREKPAGRPRIKGA